MKREVFISLIFLLVVSGLVNAGCMDDDGGKDIYTEGSATFKGDDGIIIHITSDSCAIKIEERQSENGAEYLQGLLSCNGSNCYVLEGYCSEYQDSFIDAREFIKCPNECKNGACLEETDNIKTCILEPGKAYYPGTEKCCGDLKSIFGSELEDGRCWCTEEDNSCVGAPICAPCGNGECENEYGEDKCNCPEDCSLSDVECELISLRKDGNYCSYNKEWEKQKKVSAECENNFECKSNVCISGECISEGLIKKILNWFKKLFFGE
ncbi:MAG: hypothetical protein KJ646_03330 [Nanoarchaeota archaeon]|nr:hypothetical protein [Nanoarchaeota archaeon]MBU4116275.1 hypothetical protein [Nanoarchaeota archaeon]